MAPIIRRRESPLNLYLVAIIIRCSFVSSGVHATPDIFRSFFFIANAADGEKHHFSWSRKKMFLFRRRLLFVEYLQELMRDMQLNVS